MGVRDKWGIELQTGEMKTYNFFKQYSEYEASWFLTIDAGQRFMIGRLS